MLDAKELVTPAPKSSQPYLPPATEAPIHLSLHLQYESKTKPLQSNSIWCRYCRRHNVFAQHLRSSKSKLTRIRSMMNLQQLVRRRRAIVVTVIIVVDDEEFVVVIVAFGFVVVVVGEFEVLKQFWHMLLVARLPMKQQLLIQRRVFLCALNSVSSFFIFWAMVFWIGTSFEGFRQEREFFFFFFFLSFLLQCIAIYGYAQ